MGRTRIGAVAIVAAAFSLVLVPHSADATVMVEVPLDEMARDADAIVFGTVTRSGARLELGSDGSQPWTVTEIRVREWIKGGSGERVLVHEIGGEVQDRGMWIEGTPRYRPGEEVVVFLRRDTIHPDRFRTFGMVQGKFVVQRGVPGVPSSLWRDLDGVAFARWAANGTMTVQPGGREPAMHLETFLDHVRAVVRAVGGAR